MDDFDMGLLDDVAYMRTVLRQKLLGLHPVFMYKIKEQQPGQEYLAEGWPLRKPLQQCSLRVERRGDILLVVFTYKKEGSPPALFAVCKIDLEEYPMEHFVQPVGDSSRFFAVRVTDEKGGREAIIGLGFKEREESADFQQCLINYQNAMARERLDRANQMARHQQ